MTTRDMKDQYTIHDAWVDLGLEQPRSWISCKVPYREDRSPSFSVYNDGRSFKDFSSGEGGDVFDFWATVRGIDLSDAIQEISARLGGARTKYAKIFLKLRPPKRKRVTEVVFPESTRNLSAEEMRLFADVRGISPKVLHALQHLDDEADESFYSGLRYVHYKGQDCILLAESSFGVINTAIRRLDGESFYDRKESCLEGSVRGLPMGSSMLTPGDTETPVMLVEGSMDWLAAWHLICATKREGDDLAAIPLGILGSSNSIHEDTLDLMTGRKVVIYPHLDSKGQGQSASETWRDQLEGVGCKVRMFDFSEYPISPEEPVGDLNDLLNCDKNTKKLAMKNGLMRF